jgi:predicted MFS family arabinose efflux permease
VICQSKWSFLRVLSVFFILEFGCAFLTPVWSVFTHHLGAGVREAGIAVAVYSIVFSIMTFIISLFYYRLPKRNYLYPLSLFLTAIGFFIYSLIRSVYELYALQLYLAIVSSVQPVAFARVYSDEIKDENPELAWGIYESSYLMCIGIGSLVSAHLVYYFGFNMMFYVMTACGLLATALYLFMVANEEII